MARPWIWLTAVLTVLAAVAGAGLYLRGERLATPVSAVWHPPAASASAPASPPPPTVTPTAPPTTPSAALSRVFPVQGNSSYARDHHDYPAADIMAACGTPIVAVTDGVVLDAVTVDRFDPAENDGATRGGLAVSVLGDDGVRYYGSHYETIEAGIRPGARVSAGQRLGTVGRTGNASACHLHFGLSPPCARVGDWWVQRGVIWPWSYLDSWRAGENTSPADEIAAWQADHGCPESP